MKINKKIKVLAFLILISLVGIGIFRFFPRDKSSSSYDSVLVERGDIVQTVQTTGQVISAKEIDLGFEIQGRIKALEKDVGEEVRLGNVLATLESRDLEIQVLEALASLDVARASLEQVLAGASKEEIRVYETAVENAEIALSEAQTSLKNKQQSLSDVEAEAEDDLEASLEDALSVLDDSSLKIYNAFIAVDSIQRTYFNKTDQQSINVKENKAIIENAMNEVDSYLEIAKENPTNESIDTALLQTESGLEAIFNALVVIRDTCEAPTYRSQVLAADKTSLDNQKSYINTALTGVVNSQQSISSTKLTNESSVNTAEAQVDSAKEAVYVAEGSLKSAKDKLDQIKSLPQKEEISLARAKLEQAEAALLGTQEKLSRTELTSPCNGVITDIKKEKGEIITTTEVLISMICEGRLQVEIDVAETDIGKVSVSDVAEITLDAFPGEFFTGAVIKIDPAETIIQGVVYYKVTVSIKESGKSIKPGMTAEATITTDFRKDVLFISQRAITIRENESFVTIVENGNMKEVKVETGIRDESANIEIMSGLKLGDEVVTFVKEDK